MRRRSPTGRKPGPLRVRAFAFALSGTVLDMGSSPAVGQWDVLCINSNTTVATPAGWTAQVSSVASQGAYIFVRKAVGGEGTSATINTTGDHNTTAVWTTWPSFTAATPGGSAQGVVSGVGTPALATGALPAGSTVIVFAALHNVGTANQSGPVWTTGQTPIRTQQGSQPAVSGNGATGTAAWCACAVKAPTAGLNTGMSSWSGDPATDRYTLFVALTP